MQVAPDDLVEGEELVASQTANAVVQLTDYGLGDLLGNPVVTATLSGQEAIGGKIHLTTHRLLFKSHRLNRVQGSISIYLPTIVSLGDARLLLRRIAVVATPSQEFRFVVNKVDRFKASVQARIDALDETDVSRIRQAAVDYLDPAAGMKARPDVERMIGRLVSAADTSLNLADLASLLNVADLLRS